jgi:hypothetical protein
MKYLKLFESFGFEDVLEDIKWILIEMSEGAKLYRHEKDYCMLYELPGGIDAVGIESAKGRLDELGYELVYIGTPAVSTRELQGKQICWIVKSEFFRGPYLGNVDRDSLPTRNEEYKAITALQNNILLEMWIEKPEIDNAKLATLLILNRRQVVKVDEWFREFLGPKAGKIVHSLVKPGDRHRIQKGGYDFEIVVQEIKIDSEYVDIHCEVLEGGEVTIFSEEEQPTLSLEEATENENFGWEIENEIKDCIEDYFYTAIGIRNKTGYSIDAVDWTFE